MDRFHDNAKLPTNKSIIGVLRNLTEKKFSHDVAIAEVSKLVYAKYFHDTVYCQSKSTIRRKMKKLWDTFKEGRKRWAAGRTDGKAIESYNQLRESAEELFDVYPEDEARKKVCEKEWGVKMIDRERVYYNDQKSAQNVITVLIQYGTLPC